MPVDISETAQLARDAQRVGPVPSLALLAMEGPDARKFLQGQLTCDVRKLTPSLALLGACTTGQGRVDAVTAVVERDGALLLVLPPDMADHLLVRFRKMKLGANVRFEMLPWTVGVVSADQAAASFPGLSTDEGASVTHNGLTALRFWGQTGDVLVVAPAGALIAADDSGAAERSFHAKRIAAGVPQVVRATATQFVPQTLNLDLIAGVAYDKGCYVGQEVVARARRGGVPRRVFGYEAACPAPLPGSPLFGPSGEVGSVLDAVDTEAGCTLLAVVDVEHATAPMTLTNEAGAQLTPRALPYAVPTQKA
jgi:folate-binding protein YgfZ